MCIYVFCFSISKIKINKHLTNTISCSTDAIIHKENSPRATEDRTWENQRTDSTEHCRGDAGRKIVACSDRPYGDPKIQWDSGWKRERESGEKNELEEDPDSQTPCCHLASHRGLLELVVFGFPHTLCPSTSGRLSSLRRIRFREGRGTQGELLHNVFHSALVHTLPERKNPNNVFSFSDDGDSERTCTWRPQL